MAHVEGQPGGGRRAAPAAGMDGGGRQRPLGRGDRGRRAEAKPPLGNGDHDQNDAQPGPVASSTSDATVRRCGTLAKHVGVPLRRVRAVEGAGRPFSAPSSRPVGGPCGDTSPPVRRQPGRGTDYQRVDALSRRRTSPALLRHLIADCIAGPAHRQQAAGLRRRQDSLTTKRRS
jgi:hypothetical protein